MHSFQFVRLERLRNLNFSPRLPSRRKHEPTAPVAESSEARQKFANAKAISSDMFFGREANAEVCRPETIYNSPPKNLIVLNIPNVSHLFLSV